MMQLTAASCKRKMKDKHVTAEENMFVSVEKETKETIKQPAVFISDQKYVETSIIDQRMKYLSFLFGSWNTDAYLQDAH